MTRRFKRAELREHILSAGLRVLYQRGLRATAGHVPMTEALRELEETHDITLSMGSVFGPKRLWRNVSEFQIDLFEAALADHPRVGPSGLSIGLVRDLPDYTDLPFDERRNIFRDLCLEVGELTRYPTREGPHPGWSMWTAIWSVALNDDTASDRLLPALRDDEDRAIERIIGLIDQVFSKLGMRTRDPYSTEDLAKLIASLIDGVTLRSGIAPEGFTDKRRPDDDKAWTLLGIGLDAFLTEFLEDAL